MAEFDLAAQVRQAEAEVATWPTWKRGPMRAMYDLTSGGTFIDANGRQVQSLDVVEYRQGARRGILMEAMHDGVALVLFRDTKKVEDVNWHHLCKVPLIDEA